MSRASLSLRAFKGQITSLHSCREVFFHFKKPNMNTAEEPTEKMLHKMLLELKKILVYFRWLISAGIIAGGGLLWEGIALAGPWWIRLGIGWLGLSLLGAVGWIWLGAYRRIRQEALFYRGSTQSGQKKAAITSNRFLYRIRRVAGSLYFLSFLDGLFISLLLVASLQDKYESSFFDALSRKVTWDSRAYSEDSLLVRAVDVCHEMLLTRSDLFNNEMELSLIDKYIHPLSSDLIAANGSCGSYSFVLARLLQTMDYPVRLVQMRAGDTYGVHILLEVRSARGWVVLDPLYNLHFRRPDGQLASFHDVAGNWSYYRLQTPKDYNSLYRYEGGRYTNWNKIPLVLPALKKVLSCFMNKESVEHFSLRTWFLRKYLLLKYILLILAVMVSSKIVMKIAIPGIRLGKSQYLYYF
jgi:hypothetical protein